MLGEATTTLSTVMGSAEGSCEVQRTDVMEWNTAGGQSMFSK